MPWTGSLVCIRRDGAAPLVGIDPHYFNDDVLNAKAPYVDHEPKSRFELYYDTLLAASFETGVVVPDYDQTDHWGEDVSYGMVEFDPDSGVFCANVQSSLLETVPGF